MVFRGKFCKCKCNKDGNTLESKFIFIKDLPTNPTITSYHITSNRATCAPAFVNG